MCSDYMIQKVARNRSVASKIKFNNKQCYHFDWCFLNYVFVFAEKNKGVEISTLCSLWASILNDCSKVKK